METTRWQRSRSHFRAIRRIKSTPEVIGTLLGITAGLWIPLAFHEAGFILILWAVLGALIGFYIPPVWGFLYTATTHRTWLLEQRMEQLEAAGPSLGRPKPRTETPEVQRVARIVEEAALLKKRLPMPPGRPSRPQKEEISAWLSGAAAALDPWPDKQRQFGGALTTEDSDLLYGRDRAEFNARIGLIRAILQQIRHQ